MKIIWNTSTQRTTKTTTLSNNNAETRRIQHTKITIKRRILYPKDKIKDNNTCIKNKWPKKHRHNDNRHQKPNINAKNKKTFLNEEKKSKADNIIKIVLLSAIVIVVSWRVGLWLK